MSMISSFITNSEANRLADDACPDDICPLVLEDVNGSTRPRNVRFFLTDSELSIYLTSSF